MPDYIPVHTTLRHHKRLRMLARELGATREEWAHLRGYLVTLWINVKDYHCDGVLQGWDAEDLAFYAEYYGDSSKWAEALIASGLVVEIDDEFGEPVYAIHDHEQYYGLLRARGERTRERMSNAERQRRYRERKKAQSSDHEKADTKEDTRNVTNVTRNVTPVTRNVTNVTPVTLRNDVTLPIGSDRIGSDRLQSVTRSVTAVTRDAPATDPPDSDAAAAAATDDIGLGEVVAMGVAKGWSTPSPVMLSRLRDELQRGPLQRAMWQAAVDEARDGAARKPWVYAHACLRSWRCGQTDPPQKPRTEQRRANGRDIEQELQRIAEQQAEQEDRDREAELEAMDRGSQGVT